MGYLKKGGTVCNPAKKSLTVFQNSATRTVPVYGTVSFSAAWIISAYTHELTVHNGSPYTLSCYADGRSFTVGPNSNGSSGSIYGGGRTGYTISCNSQVLYSGQNDTNVSKSIQVGSKTETYWNTRWRKLSA